MRTNAKLNLFLLITGSVFIAFLSVFLFTRSALIKNFVLTETGQIGDTIGGITSPIFGLIGFVLVFYSFKEQFRANKIQLQALENEKNDRQNLEFINFLTKLVENLDEKIDLFEIHEKKPGTVSNGFRPFDSGQEIVYLKINGAKAIRKFCMQISSIGNSSFNDKQVTFNNYDGLADLYYLINYLGYINTKLKSSKVQSDSIELLKERFNLIYRIKIQEPFNELLYSYRHNASRIKIFEELDLIRKQMEEK